MILVILLSFAFCIAYLGILQFFFGKPTTNKTNGFSLLGLFKILFKNSIKLLLLNPIFPSYLGLLTYLFHTLGELCLSPVGLSATAKYAPKRYKGQMMGIWFLSSSLAAGLAGLLASKSLESGLSSMPGLFNQIILALVVVGVILIIANKFVKATTDLEE